MTTPADKPARCAVCGYAPLHRYYGRAWAVLTWRETLYSPKRIDPVCQECMRTGEALRCFFRHLRAAVFPRFSRRSFRFRIPRFSLLTHHHKPLL